MNKQLVGFMAIIVIIFSVIVVSVITIQDFLQTKTEVQDSETSVSDLPSQGQSIPVSKKTPEWFAEYLSTFLDVNFKTFSSTSEINNESLLTFGIFGAIKKENQYNSNENGNTIISADKVKAYISNYFDITVNDKTIKDFAIYNEKTKSYEVVPMGLTSEYAYAVTKVNFIGDKVEVIVDFFDDTTPSGKSVFTRKIILSEKDSSYKFVSYTQNKT